MGFLVYVGGVNGVLEMPQRLLVRSFPTQAYWYSSKINSN